MVSERKDFESMYGANYVPYAEPSIRSKTWVAHPSVTIEYPCTIGDRTKIWHFSHIMSGAHIGKDCVLGQNVYVGGRAYIGDCVHIQNNVSVYDGVSLDDDVFVGPSAVFTNVTYPRSFSKTELPDYGTTRVGRGASIGANATILPGVTIGEYAMVGAGAVVVKDVKPFQTVVGNPAKALRGIVAKSLRRRVRDGEG